MVIELAKELLDVVEKSGAKKQEALVALNAAAVLAPCVLTCCGPMVGAPLTRDQLGKILDGWPE